PELSYESLAPADPGRPELPSHVKTKVEVQIKYAGYIDKQQNQIERFKRLEGMALPEDIDYTAIESLRLEAVEKLDKIRPASLGQASGISGVSPADINVLLIWLEKKRRER
ncbi:MAG: tRNA uridine-5-carboxymethylaminomethyl(34) synthesis enzyme MnmG, partial [Firmicutes bacterium]|nr:tRNA uridine-5-carboxymethylaminomethyl(34) synthesis enzyme MnmG [Bacillota bacterium]